jgi:phosphoglycerate dehydrogenase-like enzyme
VLLSPHLAGSTNEARVRMVSSTLRNLDRVLRGGAPEHVINGVEGVPRRKPSNPAGGSFVYSTVSTTLR